MQFLCERASLEFAVKLMSTNLLYSSIAGIKYSVLKNGKSCQQFWC